MKYITREIATLALDTANLLQDETCELIDYLSTLSMDRGDATADDRREARDKLRQAFDSLTSNMRALAAELGLDADDKFTALCVAYVRAVIDGTPRDTAKTWRAIQRARRQPR